MSSIDKIAERFTRTMAHRYSRRSILALLGGAITGAAVVPVLPVSRAAAAAPAGGAPGVAPQFSGNPQDPGDQTQCDYWRYCAISGALCTCCGGTPTTCPPGTEMSPITWIGTCINPADGRAYIISYNDCCGKSVCNRCHCHTSLNDRPIVRPQSSNDYMWCLGTQSGSIYNCSTAIILGTALED